MPFDAYGYGQVKLSIYLARERRKGLWEVRGQRKGDMGRGKGAEKRGKGTG